MMLSLLIGISLLATILSTIALIYCIQLNIKVVAMEKSTHSIQYVPADHLTNSLDENGFEIVTDDTKKKFDEEEFN